MSQKLTVGVYNGSGEPVASLNLPKVFSVPVRPDLVNYVSTNMRKNSRQAYAVSPESGYQTSAQSWGTGRAMARIPRVRGNGSSRNGQGAFANMARGGGMYAPTKAYRRWHRRINVTEKRYAIASSIAASGISSIVMARGHRIDDVKEIPLVVSNKLESLTKTKDAVSLLNSLGCLEELNRCKDTKTIRAGVGKMRGRKYKIRKGPLIIHSSNIENMKAFRNIAGVDLAHVDQLNLLDLAPGGTLGRFVIFSQAAFEKLDSVYSQKSQYALPRGIMSNTDLARIINSDEIQSVLNVKKVGNKLSNHKINPLKNHRAAEKLCIKSL